MLFRVTLLLRPAVTLSQAYTVCNHVFKIQLCISKDTLGPLSTC